MTSNKNKIRNMILRAKWAFKIVWATNRKIFLYILSVKLSQAVIPLGIALAIRGVVNETVIIMNDKGDTTLLYFWLFIGLSLSLGEAIFQFIEQYFAQRLYDELNIKITCDIINHCHKLELSSFEDPDFQNVMQRARQNVAQNIANFVNNSLVILRNLFQAVSLTVLLIIIEPLILVLLLPITIPYFIFQWKLAKTRYQLQHSQTEKKRWSNYYMSQLAHHQSIPEIKLLGLHPLFFRRFKKLLEYFMDKHRQLYLRDLSLNVIFVFFSIAAAYAAFINVALRVAFENGTVGDVAVFGGAAVRLRTIVQTSILKITKTMEQTLYISNVMEFFNTKPQETPHKGIKITCSRGEVEIKNLSFTYPNSEKPTLQNVSLHIRPGESVAIVGENGSGKTTLMKLIARLYHGNSGTILFDGYNIEDLDCSCFHQQISFVFQRFGRYEGTVMENIAFGNWQQLLENLSRVQDIAKSMGVHDLIQNMPESYQTLIGKKFGKYNLSGGEWQQIAIARAFASNASLFILDECTSSLDARAEYNFYDNFKKATKGRTSIIISHRFSTVSMADRIIVMNKGQIVEKGKHHELLEKKGVYANLYNLHCLQMGFK